MRSRQLDHFAGTHKENGGVAQIFEQALRQAHTGGRHGHRMRANFRVAAHFLGHCEGALKQLVQVRAQGVGLLSYARGIFHLPQDLRLAQDHGVQARGHPKRMAHRVCVGQRV